MLAGLTGGCFKESQNKVLYISVEGLRRNLLLRSPAADGLQIYKTLLRFIYYHQIQHQNNAAWLLPLYTERYQDNKVRMFSCKAKKLYIIRVVSGKRSKAHFHALFALLTRQFV